MALPIYISKQQNDNPELFHLRMRDFIAQNREDGWIEIMDYCCEQVPHLLKRGKPSDDDIRQSLVGALGFKSWKAFLEDIGWSINTWRYWRKAYGVVLDHKYLRNIQPKKSQIHNVKRKFKENFPDDNQAWQSAVASLKGIMITTETDQLDFPRPDTPLVSHEMKAKTNVFQFKSFGSGQIHNQKVKALEAHLAQAGLDNHKLQLELSSKSQENEILVTEIKALRQSNIELEDALDKSIEETNKLGTYALGILTFIILIFIVAAKFEAFA